MRDGDKDGHERRRMSEVELMGETIDAVEMRN